MTKRYKTIEQVKKRLESDYLRLGSWRAVGDSYGISHVALWDIVNGHEPRDNDIRVALGLPRLLTVTEDEIVSKKPSKKRGESTRNKPLLSEVGCDIAQVPACIRCGSHWVYAKERPLGYLTMKFDQQGNVADEDKSTVYGSPRETVWCLGCGQKRKDLVCYEGKLYIVGNGC